MFNPWPVVAADLGRGRAAAAAVALLVALAVGLGVAVGAQERALRLGSAAAADPFTVLVGAPGGETQLVLSTVFLQPGALDLMAPSVLADVAADPRVAWASPLAFGDHHAGHPIVGVTADLVARLARGGGIEGRAFARLDEAVLGRDVRGLAPGDGFAPAHGRGDGREGGEAGDVHTGLTHRAVGRLPRLGSPWDRAILVPVEAVWWVHSLPFGHAVDPARLYPGGGQDPDFSAVPLGPPWDAAELAGVPAVAAEPVSFAGAYAIRQRFRAADGTTAVFPAEVLVQLYALLGDARGLLAAVAGLTQALVLAAVLLAVLADLARRRRLLGVLRALGASRGFVFAAVWLGAALPLAAGAALGLGVGLALARALSAAVEARSGLVLPVALGPGEFALAGAALLAGLAAAALPAALAYRTPVAAALRG